MPENTHLYKLETEVKFSVPDQATFAALKNTTHLNGFQLQAVGTKIITDRYFDTADKQILQAGYACRIRSTKQKQTLTLKALTPPQGNIHRRQEFNLDVDSEQPQQWGQGKAGELVLKIIGNESLQLLFTIHQTRHKYHVFRQKEAIIEFSLDEVSLNHAGHIDYFELEAELLEAGVEADLSRFVKALQAQWNLPPQPQSKFERALNIH